jgi:hypothetical protein
MRKTIFVMLAAMLFVSQPSYADTLNNRMIVALSASGIGDEAIIAKIETSDVKFDLSADQMIALKKQGVSGPVIAAMLRANVKVPNASAAVPRGRSPAPARADDRARPAAAPASVSAPHPLGIYMLSEGRLVRIDFNVSGQTKTGGMLGTMMTGGIAHTSLSIVIQGDSARVQTADRQPTFYFYLARDDGNERAFQSGFESVATNPSSPNEFSLIRLIKKNGNREARVGRFNIGGMKSGVMDKTRVDFQYDEVRPGAYSVRPKVALEPGEYGFVMIGAGGAKVARIFDFSVQ